MVEIWVGLEAETQTGSAAALEIEYQPRSEEPVVQRTVDRLVVTAGEDCE